MLWFDRLLDWVRLPPDRDPDARTQRWIRKRFRQQLAREWFRLVVGCTIADAKRVVRTLSRKRICFRAYRNPLCGFAGLRREQLIVALPLWCLPFSGLAVAAHELHHYVRDHNKVTLFSAEAGMSKPARWWEEFKVYFWTLVTCPFSSFALLSYCTSIMTCLPVAAYSLSKALFAVVL